MNVGTSDSVSERILVDGQKVEKKYYSVRPSVSAFFVFFFASKNGKAVGSYHLVT